MAVWRHIATVNLNSFWVPFVCECGRVFRTMTQAAKHLVIMGCQDYKLSVGYDPKVFRLIMHKKECQPTVGENCMEGVELISDEEVDHKVEVHLPDSSYRSGLLPDLRDLEDISDVPLDFYLSESESESESECSSGCISESSECTSSSGTAIYASEMELSLYDSDDDMFDM